MEDDIKKVQTTTTVRGLRPLLEAWCTLTIEYCRLHNFEDAPWWYTERAIVGTLAAAAWRCAGWGSLEEFGSRKRPGVLPEDDVSSANNNGRIDLWVSHGSRSFVIEAKQAWQSIGRQASGDNPRVRDAAAAAWNDIGKLEIYEADTRLAATFVVPFIPMSQLHPGNGKADEAIRSKTAREFVEKWLADAGSFADVGAQAVAAAFPFDSARLIGRGEKNLFPGVVLLLRQRHKAAASKRSLPM